MKRVIITEDEYVWHVRTEMEAVHALDYEEVYLLFDDGSDRRTISPAEIHRHVRHGGYVATPVGYIDDKEN